MIEWLDDFYNDPDLRATTMRNFLPLFTEYVQAAVGPVESTFVQALAENYVERHLGSSRAQLQEVVKGADNPLAALTQRFDEWEEKRPEKVARNELVRSANAANVQQMREAGVTKMVWRASGGDTCPFCTELEGTIISVDGTFFKAGDTLNPEGATAPIHFESSLGHPPVHQGCVCSVEAVESSETAEGDADTRPPEMVTWEDEIRQLDSKVEHGAIFDAEGKLVWSGSGKRQSVPFPADLVKKGYQITHLHPGDGYVLSSVDVALAIDQKLATMRSFTASGRWMEVQTNDYAFGSSRFMFNFKSAMKVEDRAYKDFAEKLLSGAKPTATTQALLDAEYHAGYERALRVAADVIGIEMRTGG